VDLLAVEEHGIEGCGEVEDLCAGYSHVNTVGLFLKKEGGRRGLQDDWIRLTKYSSAEFIRVSFLLQPVHCNFTRW
jgi:hypothetical protein